MEGEVSEVSIMAMPGPIFLNEMTVDYVGRWVAVTEALPPQRMGVLVMLRGDNCPAYGWLKFAAGDRDCPYFVVPQRAAMEPRGTHCGLPENLQGRDDVTVWFAQTLESLPISPKEKDFREPAWGLGGRGWESFDSGASR